jgi:glycine oxidase
MPSLPPQHIVIIGAGPVGLCCALAFVKAGHYVSVLDNGARGAGWASGGMLGAVFETVDREDVPVAMRDLAFESRALWDDIAAQTGIELSRTTTFLARNLDEGKHLFNLTHFADGKTHQIDQPAAMNCRLAMTCSADATLNPRDALRKLRAACEDLGLLVKVKQVAKVAPKLVTFIDGTKHHADTIIMATGQDGNALADSVPDLRRIKKVKGQMLAVAGSPTLTLDHTVRAGRLYLIPRGDQIIIGATSNPDDNDPDRLDLVAHNALFKEAIALWPALATAQIVESWSGFRPMTGNGLPLFGPSSVKGVFLATGTYRNGWLLAPAIAARLVKAVALLDDASELLQPFSPQRFPI